MRIIPFTEGLHALGTEAGSHDMRFWEYKDRNMHRGIIDFAVPVSASRQQIEFDVRNEAVAKYAPTWARGFAFGAVIQFYQSPSFELEEFAQCVDGYNKSKGVWQWVVAIDHERQVAFAGHMWMIGSLHPMFEKTANDLVERGYDVKTHYLARPNLFKAIEKYMRFAPRAMSFLNKVQLVLVIMFGIYLAYEYFN